MSSTQYIFRISDDAVDQRKFRSYIFLNQSFYSSYIKEALGVQVFSQKKQTKQTTKICQYCSEFGLHRHPRWFIFHYTVASTLFSAIKIQCGVLIFQNNSVESKKKNKKGSLANSKRMINRWF